MSTGVILLAAGSGSRFGKKSRPKQLQVLNGRPLFLKSFRVFAALPSVKEIVLVVPPKSDRLYRRILQSQRIRPKVKIVFGGRFRGESVKNGCLALSKELNLVLVHDSARPLISKEIVRRVELAAKKQGVALAAWPLPDTLKKSNANNRVVQTIPRGQLWCAQTPQGFRRSIADKCLLRPSKTATDDVELAERRGYKVKLVLGSPQNFKVTYPHDLKVCRALS